MGATSIRQCRRSDLSAIVAIEEACYGAPGALPRIALTQYADLAGDAFVVAECGSTVLGFAVAANATCAGETVAWFLDVAVTPIARRQGIGYRLCSQVLSVLRCHGVKQIRATVSPDNEGSLKMLARLGFYVIADIPDYFGPEHRRFLMQKTLTETTEMEKL